MGSFPVQQAFNGGEISRLGSARSDQVRYQTGCLEMRNFVATALGPMTRRPGMGWCGESAEQDMNKPALFVPFVFSETQARLLEFTDGKLRVWSGGELVAASGGGVYELSSPYLAADIPGLRTEQSADVVYIASRNHPPRRLVRRADNNWEFLSITFLPGIAAPTGLAGSAVGGSGSTAYRYVLTTVSDETGEESLPSAPVTVNNAASLSGTVYNHLSWTAVAGALEYRVYREKSGVYGFIGRALDGSVVFDDKNLAPDAEDTPPAARNPFANAGDYPAVVFWWEQRLGWASTENDPLNIWMSQSALPESMAASRPPAADDAIERRMAGQRQNEIMWLAPDRYLAVGTSGAEITLVGTDDGPLTPNNVRFVHHSERGSARLNALRAGSQLLFVQRGGRVVREFLYNFSQDKYDPTNLSVWVPHLFLERRVVSWAYQQGPHSIVWVVMDDGKVLGLTYLREHDVIAWHRHETDGFVEQVECIPGPDGDDETYFVVRRTAGGVERRYLERLGVFFEQPTPENAFFVDCGVSYTGEPTDTLGGLGHLEGREVSILANGFVHPPRTVTDGAIALDNPASAIHVGLPFSSVGIPTRPEFGLANGTTLTRIARINQATLRVYQSMGVLAGADEDSLYEVVGRDASDPTAVPFVTDDDVSVVIDGGWQNTTTLRIQVNDPTPCTVVATVYDITMASNTGQKN